VSHAYIIGVDDQELCIRRVAKPFGKGLGVVLGGQVERRAQKNNEQQRELAIFHAHTRRFMRRAEYV
jgi:hypothetical protein